MDEFAGIEVNNGVGPDSDNLGFFQNGVTQPDPSCIIGRAFRPEFANECSLGLRYTRDTAILLRDYACLFDFLARIGWLPTPQISDPDDVARGVQQDFKITSAAVVKNKYTELPLDLSSVRGLFDSQLDAKD